jgi:hypothetical protein
VVDEEGVSPQPDKGQHCLSTPNRAHLMFRRSSTTQTLPSPVGLRRYTLPHLPPPHLTSTPTLLHFLRCHDKRTDRMHMPLSASCRSAPEDMLGVLRHCCPLSGSGDTPSRIYHPHASAPLPLLYISQDAITNTNILIACTCRFVRRVDPTMKMCLDHSNIAVPCRVAEIHPSSSTTSVPHLHSHCFSNPELV